MDAEGRVISIDGDCTTVQVKRKGACGDQCAHCAGCNADIMVIKAHTYAGVVPGDWVRLSSERTTILMGLFSIFVLPLLLPLAGYFLSVGSGLEFLFVAIGILLSGLLIYFLNKSNRFQIQARPKIIEIIKTEGKKNE